jgi:hypothetical protein
MDVIVLKIPTGLATTLLNYYQNLYDLHVGEAQWEKDVEGDCRKRQVVFA